MTQVIKRNGSRENFNIQKLRKSIENAVSEAGFSVTEKMNLIEHATQDAENLVKERNEVKSQELRNEIVNDLEEDDSKVAESWRNYEKQHGMK